ncbi:MAG: PH domain-containing protein [Psychrosphaera sp.]|nr:PH domain-containing protein [Psychrosphaera sp.]
MTTFTNTQITVDDIPAVSSVEFTDLHPKYCKVNLTDTIVWVTIPLIPLSLILIKGINIPLIWVILLFVLLVPLAFVLSYYRAKARRYALREHDILFQQGLIWQKTTAVAFNRIQHIDLTHGPLERKYQFSSLKFFTAGGSSVDLKIPGLPEDDAQQIRALILGKINQSPDQDSPDQGSLHGKEAAPHDD